MPRAPAKSERADYEYSRKDSCNIFLFTEPPGGGRFAEATERRTRIDWAKQIRRLLAEEYPDARKVVLWTIRIPITPHPCMKPLP
jgi:hypothetical protein